MKDHRIVMKVGEAILLMESRGKQNMELYKELVAHEDKEDWLVEVADEQKFYIVKNCPENNKLLLRHQVVDLSPT